jgi:hypothetical protein
VYGANSEPATEEEMPSEEGIVTAGCNDFILFQYLGIWIFLDPLAPLGVLGGNFGEPSFEVSPLDAHEALSIRIPEATRLSVV